MPNNVPRLEYLGVQALRFVAALMVVVTHSTFYASERLGTGGEVWSQGAAGVDIFFVISGFVMVVSSQREAGWIDWKDFVYRRVVRILPPYWVATTLNLLVLISVPALVLHSTLDWVSVFKSYFLIPSFNSGGAVEPLLGVGWTLYYESFFYAAFALTLLLHLNPVWAVTGFMIGVASLSTLKGAEWPAYTVYLNPIVLEFAAGMLIGAAGKSLRAPFWASTLLLALGSVLLLFRPEEPGLYRALVSGVPAVVIVLATVLLEPWFSGKVWLRPMVFLGAASYVLYLFHPLVAPVAPILLSKLGINSLPLSVLISLALAVGFSAIVYHFAEKPFLILVKKPFWLRGKLQT